MTKVERIILSWKPVKFLTEKSKRIILPGFEKIPLYDVVVFFVKEISIDRLNDRAAAVSFNFLLAIPPTFIFLFTLLPYVPLRGLEEAMYALIHDLTPNKNTFEIVRGVIYDFLHTHRNGLLSFAFLLGFFYSSNAVLGIMRSFDKIYPNFRKRNMFQRRWVAIRITTLLILLVIISASLIIGQNAVFDYIFTWLGIQNIWLKFFVSLVRWLIIVLLFFSIISLIYTYGPATKKRWKFISAGATLATILFILTSLGFSYYVKNFSRYNQIYGSIGSIIVLMLWIYFNSLILLIGFELNASIETIKEIAKEREEQDKVEEEMQGTA